MGLLLFLVIMDLTTLFSLTKPHTQTGPYRQAFILMMKIKLK